MKNTTPLNEFLVNHGFRLDLDTAPDWCGMMAVWDCRGETEILVPDSVDLVIRWQSGGIKTRELLAVVIDRMTASSSPEFARMVLAAQDAGGVSPKEAAAILRRAAQWCETRTGQQLDTYRA